MSHSPTRFSRSVVALSAALLLASSTAAADPPAAAPRSLYRFDVTITGLEDGPRAAPATYTIVLTENQSGAVASGDNVSLGPSAAGAVARQDVGLSLRLSYSLRGETVLLAGLVEVSSAVSGGGGAATIHRMRADGVTPITPGTPALFSSVYDPVTRRRCDVTVSARRLL